VQVTPRATPGQKRACHPRYFLGGDRKQQQCSGRQAHQEQKSQHKSLLCEKIAFHAVLRKPEREDNGRHPRCRGRYNIVNLL
jgi:hypothetical protein